MTVAITETMPRDAEAVLDVQPDDDGPRGGMSIGEVAEETGAPPWKIRTLEDDGAIPPVVRSSSGARVSYESDVAAITVALATPSERRSPEDGGGGPHHGPRHVEARQPHSQRVRAMRSSTARTAAGREAEKDDAAMPGDVVMTDHGGITRTLVTCFQHKIIAIKTEFVIRRPGAGS